MKKKTIKRIISGFVLALAITASAGCAVSADAEAYSVNLSEELSYSFGESFEIPEATIVYGEQNVSATRAVLVYPDGVMVDGYSHLLQKEGMYTIIYYATVSGKVISAEKSFEVVKTDYVNLKPIITLDSLFVDGFQYKVAINESVNIPQAIAVDDNLVGGVKTTVYYNYGMSTQQIIGTENGVFTPTKVGEHAIVYSAVDAYGEKAEKIVYVNCGNAQDNVAAKLSAEDITRNAGESVAISQCTISGLYNDTSNVRVFAVFEDETEREEIFNYRYFPRNVGEYKIIYEYETPFKTYSTTSRLTTVSAGNIEINKAPLPKYFIKGARYTLDDWVGYTFDEKHPTETIAKAYVKEDDGIYTEINHRDFQVNASTSVSFKFEIGSKAIETETFKVVDVGFGGALNVKEYFQGDGFVKDENETLFTVKDGVGNYTLDFINVLSLSAFGFEFTVPTNDTEAGTVYNSLQAIDVTLTDYYDREKKLTVRYENVDGLLAITFDDAKKVNTGRAFAGVKNNFFYSAGLFADASGSTWDWGDSFTSNKILLSVTLVGVDGDAGFSVQRIGSQGFNTSSDRIEADIYYANPQGGIHQLGEVVELSVAQITDVLSPYLEKNHKFMVTAPDGSYVKSLDGVLLDGTCDVARSYEIKLESLGAYLVKYIYEDQNGNSRTAPYAMNVLERVKPTITLIDRSAGELVETDIDTWVSISDYSVSDNSADELIAYVVVWDPDYLRTTVEDGKFAALKEGDYLVCYYCYDAEGNYSTVSYTVRVS
jgi:hypothetical protein